MDRELERIRKRKMEELMKKSMIGQLKIEVDDNSFEKEVIEKSAHVPVVVDFWAEWCMPCLMLGPSLEKLVNEFEGKFVLAKMNVDNGRTTSQKYGIMSIPAVKMFRNGNVVDEFVGAIPEQAVKQWLEKNLGD